MGLGRTMCSCFLVFSLLAPTTPSPHFFYYPKIFKQYFIRKEFKFIFVCFYHLHILL